MDELRRRLPGSAQELARLFFPEPFLNQQPQLRDVFAMVRPASERARRRAEAVAASLAVTPAAITAPTLLLAGDLDGVVPTGVTLGMTALLDDCEQVVLSGVGHATAMQAPQAVADHVIRFLSDRRAGARSH
jgi:3-oxoadipate enol-lactonase